MRNKAFLLLGFVAVVGCGGDDKKAADCPPNAVTLAPTPGDLFQCTCDAAGTMSGTQACGEDLKLTDCDCGGTACDMPGVAFTCTCGPKMGQTLCDATTSTLAPCDCTGTGMPMGGMMATGGTGTGGTGTGGTGTGGTGTGGTGTGGAMATGAVGGEGGFGGMMSTGGTGGTMADQDGGAGTGSGSGGQLDACSDDADCGGGLVCYLMSFCTEPCTGDSDCSGLSGDYTCYTPMGMGGGGSAACRITCSGTSDMSCPDPLQCLDIYGGMATNPAYRCIRL